MSYLSFLPWFLFAFGLIVGSFFLSVAYRAGNPSNSKRSFCNTCRAQLKAIDLIPLLSFLVLRGKCRYCQKPISLQHPAAELLMGAAFLVIGLYAVSEIRLESLVGVVELLFLLMVASLLVAIIFYDMLYFIIPDWATYTLVTLVAFWHGFAVLVIGRPIEYLVPFIASGVVATFAFYLIHAISRGRWLGFGDVKFVFFMGLFLGFPNVLVALFLAFVIGAIMGVGLILCGTKGLKSEVPFGPFLVMGTFLALIWGADIATWYTSQIGL